MHSGAHERAKNTWIHRKTDFFYCRVARIIKRSKVALKEIFTKIVAFLKNLFTKLFRAKNGTAKDRNLSVQWEWDPSVAIRRKEQVDQFIKKAQGGSALYPLERSFLPVLQAYIGMQQNLLCYLESGDIKAKRAIEQFHKQLFDQVVRHYATLKAILKYDSNFNNEFRRGSSAMVFGYYFKWFLGSIFNFDNLHGRFNKIENLLFISDKKEKDCFEYWNVAWRNSFDSNEERASVMGDTENRQLSEEEKTHRDTVRDALLPTLEKSLKEAHRIDRLALAWRKLSLAALSLETEIALYVSRKCGDEEILVASPEEVSDSIKHAQEEVHLQMQNVFTILVYRKDSYAETLKVHFKDPKIFDLNDNGKLENLRAAVGFFEGDQAMHVEGNTSLARSPLLILQNSAQ